MARRHEPKFKVDARSPDASFRLRLPEWLFIRFSFPDLQVNINGDWETLLPYFGINRLCANGSIGLKHIYVR
jgi:hypothetical protein